ncbi:pyridoxamine 5'-phosphate oxidase family protein [Microlunatus parietis]|uniref:Pyridoxamine 5'-phosphate oxidase n=1 Tax=Microlunatus parietis TaxID=682979 RepID=A0A7Y9LCS1_9ACTN|nr:pyridoxamine 5'-phosphate oxidase family protein [Microlunatus parietis]NYE72133.1 hypothetical protein [Microlunatus parietis]
MPDQSSLFKELTRAESLYRLGSVSLGRIVFTHNALPAIRPVNHIVDDSGLIIRTHHGAAIISAAVGGVVVAYEADVIDPDTRVGWSVIVIGTARFVTNTEEISRFHRLLRPWVSEPTMDHVIRIDTKLVTGFELVPGPSEPDSASNRQS